MPASQLPPDAVVSRLLTAFREHGYDAASLGQLSKETGLGRSSLYHHFPGGKEEMAHAVFDRVDAWCADQLFAPLKDSEEPGKRLDTVIEALDAFFAGGMEPCLFGNFVVGEARPMFQERLAAAFARWIEGFAALSMKMGIPEQEATRRAEDAVVRIEGALILSRGLNDPAPFRRVLNELPQHLLG
ncbi:TetR/AcrR family transcriptional regulator [Flavobacterium sp. MXW15]|uniref:TetR/AcrR family transcriptional regulator n=1 Tax=Xanthomonas chitinilytica TaxID=2989819 RepID=A0ABT3K068_9XANT|nr:TetR/AcrR family transcriptional regulator [Xanthomonas sp. H13-6]MCW4456427.1 TetR/AcrR family transcriptional regulator [Flavobacterium sp. MXW15]MCW4474132.1 TetR/AcrR family transcriptional regulator [Xanthomonas sp. H13-6]